MLNEHGNAKPVVTSAVNRNDEDDTFEEASAEEHRSLRRIVISCHRDAQTLVLLETVWRGGACSTLTVFTDTDWIGDRPTCKSMFSWVIMLDVFLINAGTHVSDCTAATIEAKNTQTLFLACGQNVNNHLRSDSFVAIGVTIRKGLQLLRHLDVLFLWLQADNSQQEHSNQQSDRA